MVELTKEELQSNKETFLSILKTALATRPGARVEELVNKLESSDFFYAPASTRYHGAYVGGLCDHCLNVYHNAISIAKNKHLLAVHDTSTDENGNSVDVIVESGIEESSIAIVTLLHDFSKMNYYRLENRNKKVYCKGGSKHDGGGAFDWVSVPGYVTIPPEERFIYGSHEETAEFMTRQYVPLTYEESTAILHHHFAMSYDSIKDAGVVGNVYNKYPLATLLHVADTLAAFMDERY